MAGSDSAGASIRSLWNRAPLWRFSLMTAALLTLLFLLFPPRESPVTTQPQVTYNGTASYTPRPPRAIVPAAEPTASAKPVKPVAPAAAPRTATLRMAAANPAGAANATGLDDALVGRLYSGSVGIDGFAVPLLPGNWANLANSTIKQSSATGHAYFLGQIRNKRLMGAIRIFALRSNAKPGEGFNEVKSCTEVNPGRTFVSIDDEMDPQGHQACWTIRGIYATPWSQWADRAVKISILDRAAAGDMTAKGVTYPQDFISLTFTRTEKWGLLEVMYLFNPEADGIRSNSVLSVTETDWTPANIGQYPQKVAYIDKLKTWGATFWPKFKSAFDQAEHAKD
jgi:hypothetical protein